MNILRKFLILFTTASLTACGGGGGGGGAITSPPPPVSDPCSITAQKEFVLEQMQLWYLWNNRLPANVDIDNYATPQDLIDYLSTFSETDASGNPVDRFSSIGSLTSDQQFFGEGKFEGFGFSSRFASADNWRLSRVFVDSPAGRGGLARGQTFVALDGRTIAEIEAAEGIGAALDKDTIEFTMRPVAGPDFSVTLTRDIVTIDPLPQWRIIDGSGGRKIGYLEFATFISTAEPGFEEIFAEFNAQNVTEVIVDLRYNGGGLVRTAELLGDYLGGRIATSRVFSSTEFNADRAPENNSQRFFSLLGNSLNLTDLVVIATRGTASASELVTNGLDPHTRVTIVGTNTFGKPVGQIGLELPGGCDILLRPTSFKTVNADSFGEFFDGLPVDCPATDDLDIPVGADSDPNMVAALGYLETGSCPLTAGRDGVSKTAAGTEALSAGFDARRPELTGPPWREFANAY